jgi:glycosyltransferase involved in cell wall biosynthesis
VTTARPTVSIVLPALDEREHITDCLESLLAQDYDEIVEILVVDGGSRDGTHNLAVARGAAVRVLDASGVAAAEAMNAGIAAARGDVICRVGAHSRYETDYVRRCVAALVETGATEARGHARAVGTTSFGRATAAVTRSRFDVGREDFQGADGGQWAAAAPERNRRAPGSGAQVFDRGIRSWRLSPSTPRGLAWQYGTYGVEAATTLREHGRFRSWRSVAPAVLVAATVAGLGSRRRITRLALPALHAAACATAGWRLADDSGVAPHRAFFALEVSHWSYGVGLWTGLVNRRRGRSFDSRP